MTTEQSVISAIAGIIIAIIGAIPLVLKWRSSERTSAAERAAQITEQQWDRIEARIATLEESRDTWEARARELSEALEQVRQDRSALAAENRDQMELIEDFIEHHLAWELWQSTGSEPPPPVASWRIRVKLNEIQKAREHHKHN